MTDDRTNHPTMIAQPKAGATLSAVLAVTGTTWQSAGASGRVRSERDGRSDGGIDALSARCAR